MHTSLELFQASLKTIVIVFRAVRTTTQSAEISNSYFQLMLLNRGNSRDLITK